MWASAEREMHHPFLVGPLERPYTQVAAAEKAVLIGNSKTFQA